MGTSPHWSSKTSYTQLRLDPLPPESAFELLHGLLGEDGTIEPLTPILIERTEGNPFFLEETVRALIETKALVGKHGAYRLAKVLTDIQVPPTVQAILAARIDRLSPEDKRLLQSAAVIGKDVPFALLAAIVEEREEEVRRGLAHLQAAEFLYEVSVFPDLEYTFIHALTHEVTYAGLLGERRRGLHAAVTATIERLHANRLAEHVERLAHHARQGEVWNKAGRYLRQAGAKVFMRSAHREAATYFEQALDALPRLPGRPDTIAESLEIRFDLRSALYPLGETARVGILLDEAEAIAEAAGDQLRQGRALTYKVVQFGMAGDFRAAIQAGLRALAIGESQADVAIQVVANGLLGGAYASCGECREAVRHCEAALALIPDRLAQEHFGQAAIQGSYVRNQLAIALRALGPFNEAFGHLRKAMNIAEEAGHIYSLLPPLLSVGTLMLDQGDFAGAVPPLERGLDLCRTSESPLWLHDFAWALGAAYHGIGRRAEGLALMEGAARGLAERNQRWSWWAGRAGSLGYAYLVDGQLGDATRIAQDGLAAARQRGEREVEGHLLRLLGDIAAHPDRFEVDTAEAHYRQALALAEELGLRPLKAHCHLGLGKLYRRTSKRDQAQEHLTTATTMYREMGMRFWLEQAQGEKAALS